MKVKQNAMPKDGYGQGANVFICDVVSAAHEGARFAGQHQELRGANASAKVDVLFHEVGPFSVAAGARSTHNIHRIARHRFSDWSHAYELLEAEDLFG